MKYHKPPFKLREFKIEVTYKCNLNCLHCSSDASSFNTLEISKKDCLRILKEAISMGVKQVAFSGGEPLLWTGLEEAINIANNGGLNISIYTSGNVDNISSKLININKLGVKKCVFSIFGKSANLHERVTRVSGSFERSIEAIKIAVETGITTELHFVPFSNNYYELEDYTPTHCQDRNLGFLRWTHHHVLKQLERREPGGRPECQLLRRTPRLGCGSPKPGVIADYYKVQNTG